MAAEREPAEQNERDHASPEDGEWRCAELESGAVELGMRIEIAFLAHLAPRRINAERDDGQKQADDPDPEILAGPPDEIEAVCRQSRRSAVAHFAHALPLDNDGQLYRAARGGWAPRRTRGTALGSPQAGPCAS